MNNKLEFKRTEIGRIPKEWEMVRLREVGELQYGYTCSAVKEDTGIKLLRITDINDDGKVNWKSVPYCDVNKSNYEKYKLALGDILFARIGATTGKTAFVGREVKGVFASYLIKFKPLLKELETKFLYYFTQSNPYWIQVHKNKEGQLKKGLNAKVLGTIKLPLPPITEQKKIAEILSTVDQAIEKVDEAIKKTQRLKNGLMQELLTKGIGHKEFKETEIGRIPKKWEVNSVAEVGTLQYGITKTAIKVGTGVKFLRITDITDEGVKWDDVPYCELTKNELEKYELKDGNILFARIGATTGKTCFIEKAPKGVFGSYLLRMQPSKDIDTKLLYFFTQSASYWNQVNAVKGGQLKGGLNTKLLGSIKLPIPPLFEQQKIAEILSTVDGRLELLRKRKERLERTKKGLMNDLLTGRVRVKG
ncbi:MAG: restriction endonuclease subunit S [Nitrospirota bacterium]